MFDRLTELYVICDDFCKHYEMDLIKKVEKKSR
jgi:hypothetical protein